MRGRFSHPREKRGGADTGPSPVDRRKTGSKYHLICDGRGTPLQVITTAANVNDLTQILVLVDGIPPVAGRPGRPRRRTEALLGDTGYDSNAHRDELRRRRILPVISRKGSPNIKGMGKHRYVVEQTLALLHHFKRLAVRWERLTELHDVFVSRPAVSSAGDDFGSTKRLTGVRAGQDPSGLFQNVGTLRTYGEAGRRSWQPCRRVLRAVGSEKLASASSSVD
ncbi:transposase [Streptomyces sp. NPDC050759]|uniref:transposase n=1 Tax=Streptomyces sp. NPDC050759 TaxID=3365635 RepID=UPI00378E8A66